MMRSKRIKGEPTIPPIPADPLHDEIRKCRLEEFRSQDEDRKEFGRYQRLPNLLFEGRYFRSPGDFAYLLCDVVKEMKRRGNPTKLPGDDIYRKAGRELIALAEQGSLDHLATRVLSLSVSFSDPLRVLPKPEESYMLQAFWCDDPNDAGTLLLLRAGAPGCHYLRIGLWLDLAALGGVEQDEGVFYDPKLPLEFDPPMPFPKRCSRMSELLRDYLSKRAMNPETTPPLFVVRGIERIRRHPATAARLPAESTNLRKASTGSIEAILGILDEMGRTAAFDIEPRFPIRDDSQEVVDRRDRQERPTVRVSENRIAREGDSWTIRFQGTERRFPALKGIAYIAVLLEGADKDLTPSELLLLAEPADTARAKPLNFLDVDDAGSLELSIEPDGGTSSGLDVDDIRDYVSQLKDLRFDLDHAKKLNDQAEMNRLQQGIEAIQNVLEEAANNRGRPRQNDTSATRAFKSVWIAVERARRKIREKLPTLEAHFSKCLKIGNACRYESNGTVWSVAR